MRLTILLALFTLFLFHTQVIAGQIFTCKDEKGNVRMTNISCKQDETKEKTINFEDREPVESAIVPGSAPELLRGEEEPKPVPVKKTVINEKHDTYKAKWCAGMSGKLDQAVNGVTVDCVVGEYAVKVAKLTTWEDLIDKAYSLRDTTPQKHTGVAVIYDKNKYSEFQQFKAVAESRGIAVWAIKSDYIGKKEPKPNPVKKIVKKEKSDTYKLSSGATPLSGKVFFTPSRKEPVAQTNQSLPKQQRQPQVVERIIVKERVVIHTETKVVEKSVPTPRRCGPRKPWLYGNFLEMMNDCP